MFDKQVAKLGEKLSSAFTERARYYFDKAAAANANQDNHTSMRMNLVGAILGEVAQVITHVTTKEQGT